MKRSPFIKVNQNEASNTAYAQQPVIYITNHTVACDVLNLFRTAVQTNQAKLANEFNQPSQQQFTRSIALIISQILKIVVRHSRWMYIYDGKIYRMCESNAQLEPVIRELCEQISFFIPGFICSSCFVKGVIAEFTQMCEVVDYPYDISRYIVFNNGILDLATMNLLPFMPGMFITSMVNVDWNPYMQNCPNFDSLLSVYTRNDPVLYERLLEVLGVCITNDIVKSIFCFEGITNSGKSFIVNYIINMLNPESAVSMSSNDFDRTFSVGKVFNKSICVCHDLPAEPINIRTASVMKQISGGDMIGAEFKYQNGNVSFVSRAHLLLCSNFDITPESEDIAFNMRKVIVPFTHRITNENIHPDALKEMLYPEREAIVQKLVYAYLNLKRNNYVFAGTGTWIDSYVPPTAFEADKNRSIMLFISNCCDITGNPSDYEFTADLYNAYTQFALASNGSGYKDVGTFSRDFSKQCCCAQTKKRRNPGENPVSCFTGIKLK